jgi:hypothetical protein
VKPLKLTADQLPAPATLLGAIEGTFATGTATLGFTSDPRELLKALALRGLFQIEPGAAVMSLEEERHKWPAMTNRQAALIKWLLQSVAYWEVSYPLEPVLANQCRNLVPLLARLALEPGGNFTTPGAHPVHRLLDALQAAAVGWQPGLGRAGDSLEHSLLSTIESLSHPVPGWRLCISRRPPTPISTCQGTG